jgi:hypothetical protein
MNKLLLDTKPLVVLPELAVAIGLNEAIVLQQIHYWTEINKKASRNLHDGYYWTYNSIKKWQEQFPFWSEKTIRNILERLESEKNKSGEKLIITGNYNKLKIDRTKWYRINYEKLPILSPFGKSYLMQVPNSTEPLPETNLTDTINKISEKGTSATAGSTRALENDFIFDSVPKKDNIFERATHRFGEDKCKQALSIVDNFVDEHYPKYTGKKHGKLNKAQRMVFALKILECEDETEIYITNFEPMFEYMLHHYDKSNCDPTILYATTPKVLGYWLERKYSDIEFYNLLHTSYAPVETYY